MDGPLGARGLYWPWPEWLLYLYTACFSSSLLALSDLVVVTTECKFVNRILLCCCSFIRLCRRGISVEIIRKAERPLMPGLVEAGLECSMGYFQVSDSFDVHVALALGRISPPLTRIKLGGRGGTGNSALGLFSYFPGLFDATSFRLPGVDTTMTLIFFVKYT